MLNRRPNVTVVSFPVGKAFAGPLSNLSNVCCSIARHVNVIVGSVEDVAIDLPRDNARVFPVRHHPGAGLTGIVKYALEQLRISWLMMRLSRETDVFLFIGQGPPVLNLLAAKLTRRPIIWILPSSLVKTSKLQKHWMSLFLARFQPACYGLSDRLVVYSDRLVDEWDLTRYRNKISIAHEHYIDTHKFFPKKEFKGRDEVIGYVGRFSQEKGVMNFLWAMKSVLVEKPGLKVLMIGNGTLTDKVNEFILKNGMEGRVIIEGWVAHDDLPQYFNSMKLLVLPSYTEGLPNVLIEAMACGTPVLTTPVGAVPDIVKDGDDGYVMADNRPETIARSILKALDDPRLGETAEKGRLFINKNYVYEVSVEKYTRAMECVLKN